MGGFCLQLVLCGGLKKAPYRKPIVKKKKNRPKNLFKSEKKRNFAT